MIRPFPRPARNLGTFTVAQWAPIGPLRGDVATLADTYDGVSFSWTFEYRPDLDSTYPWRNLDQSFGSLLNSGWVVKGHDNNTSYDVTASWSTGPAPVMSIAPPRPGVWYASPASRFDATEAGTYTFYLGMNKSSSTFGGALDGTNEAHVYGTSGGAPYGIYTEFSNVYYSAGRNTPKDFTVLSGESLYLWTKSSVGSGDNGRSRRIFIKPARIV
jgi:hypothetical protein